MLAVLLPQDAGPMLILSVALRFMLDRFNNRALRPIPGALWYLVEPSSSASGTTQLKSTYSICFVSIYPIWGRPTLIRAIEGGSSTW